MDRERHGSVPPLSPGDAHTERTQKGGHVATGSLQEADWRPHRNGSEDTHHRRKASRKQN